LRRRAIQCAKLIRRDFNTGEPCPSWQSARARGPLFPIFSRSRDPPADFAFPSPRAAAFAFRARAVSSQNRDGASHAATNALQKLATEVLTNPTTQ